MTNNVPAFPSFLGGAPTRSIADDLVSGIGSASPPYISIESNRFTLVDANGDKEKVGGYDRRYGPYVDVCIVETNRNTSRIYYGRPFDPQATNFVPPDCWSDNGLAPSKSCSSPQSATCASCPKAEWGSATSNVSGKGVPACGTYKKIALILADAEPNVAPPTAFNNIWLMRIPPASLKNLRATIEAVRKNIVDNRRLEPSDLVIRVYFEDGKQGILKFQPIGYITEPMFKLRTSIWQTNAAEDIVGRNDIPIDDGDRQRIAAGVANTPQQRGLAGQIAPPSAHANVPIRGGTLATTPAPLSERAMATRADGPAPTARQQEIAQTAKPTKAKRQKVQQEAQQQGEDIPAFLDRRNETQNTSTAEADVDHEAVEAAQDQKQSNGQFGIVSDAPNPPSSFEGALGNLFAK